MRNIASSWVLWTGMAMLAFGFEIWFSHDFDLPIAFVWIVGPLLWYGGFMVVCSVFLKKIFCTRPAETTPVKASPATTHAVKTVTAGMLLLMMAVAPSQLFGADAVANFKGKCAMCHGANGDGKTAMGTRLNIPAFQSKTVQDQTDKDLAAAISKGKNKMPAFGAKLSDKEITDLVAFVRQLRGR